MLIKKFLRVRIQKLYFKPVNGTFQNERSEEEMKETSFQNVSFRAITRTIRERKHH